ncbi:hypothetical protein ALI144C_38770 [Actinosynnema sp. ALI-1.44]|uniref:hypothetical protein n=1 Tax=Actinosynnema sp. ALI-1.44 TaxID=1933779 RepID=UPI00097BB484|nr:hypothetical protein [Actinosynnema sp. ALI-1.44]ONI75315.1 hypothetical protein ALI144C_38770 [Actinosynnema sp. ALI-1.44]
MTSWTEVINYVRIRYEVLEENDDWLRFRLDTEGGRTQQVSVHAEPETLELSSPVGWADKIDMGKLRELAGAEKVGEVEVVDGVALLKHSVPVTELSAREDFEPVLKQIVANADHFERELAGTDDF